MLIKKIIVICSLIIYVSAEAQDKARLISGPWAGNVDLRSATIWAEVSAAVKTVAVKFSANGEAQAKTVFFKGAMGNEFNPVKIELNGLELNTTYEYTLIIDGKKVNTDFKTIFKTKELWQHRKPAPDFNFLAGSCSYFNEPLFDRPGKPYGIDSSIFNVMAETKAAFNLWLGDAWYTREADFFSSWGLNYRASRDRSMKIVQKFMAAMPQYYIWDDHDYGPNNSGKEFILKEESRKIFKSYTLNPSYGEEGKGIYTMTSFSDVDLFLTDDRYFRADVKMADSIDRKPNPAKTYFGDQQMSWLKNALLYSNATFKIIATGNQVLNPVSSAECMGFYSFEYNDLMNFLKEHNVNGVVFLSGDRHHSEVIKQDRANLYPLYDITISPLTASISTAKGREKDNPARIKGTLVEAQNFGNISVTGKKNERVLKVVFTGIKGETLATWQVSEQELKSERMKGER